MTTTVKKIKATTTTIPTYLDPTTAIAPAPENPNNPDLQLPPHSTTMKSSKATNKNSKSGMRRNKKRR
jgi:hypothetical protein